MHNKIIKGLLIGVLTVSLVGCGSKTAETAVSNDTTSPSSAAVQKSNINYSLNTKSVELTDEDKVNIMEAYDFAKTDGYISNEELRGYIGDDLIASFANLATTYVDVIYDVNAVNIENDRESYNELMNKMLSDNCIVGTAGASFKDAWTTAVLESGAVMTASFTTGKNYVYADDTEIYVRGILNLKVESAKDLAKLQAMLPVDVEIGKEYNFVYDIGFVAMGDEGTEEVPEDNGKIDYILALATF